MLYIDFLREYGPRLIDGVAVTAWQTFAAALLAVFLATCFGLMRLSQLSVIRWAATAYIEFFRGTSLLIQLYWIFFVLPLLGVTLDKNYAGFIAVGLNLGAYGAELVRGAVESVPRGQYEAALALNMSPLHRMKRIIFPQALVLMLPSWGNLMVELLKATSLIALISVSDLMYEARAINSVTFLSVEAFGTALILYYLMARLVISPLMRALEAYCARKVRGL